MTIRRTVRRSALVAAAAVALVPATASVAAAQSPDDLCAMRDEAPEEMAPLLDALAPVIDALCAEDDGGPGGDDDGESDEGGPTGTPLDDLLALLDPDQLPTEELCGLRDQAPEEMAPLLDALAPVLDAVCGEAAEDEPAEEETVEDDTVEDETADLQDESGFEHDPGTVAPSTAPTLPHTGGGAALAGLGMLGAAIGLRRAFGTRS
jgi:hypothetical protein